MQKPGLVFREPRRPMFWLGVFCASLIPVCVGLFFFFQLRNTEFEYYEKLGVIWPLALNFIIASPLVAFFSARRTAKLEPVKRGDVFKIALARASSAQFVFGMAHIAAVVSLIAFGVGGGVKMLVMIAALGIVYHLVLWLLVTLPLTFICMWIFRVISLRNETPRRANLARI